MGWSSSTEIILGDRLTAEDLLACAEKNDNGGYESEDEDEKSAAEIWEEDEGE
jgi:hypothetical protein